MIREDLRSKLYSCDEYPSSGEIERLSSSTSWLPSQLLFFLEQLVKSPLKQASIGQALVYACRPRSCIPPLLFGLAIEADHKFKSRWLIDHLHKLGFSVGVDEVTRFKQSVVANDDNELGIDVLPGSFSQWSGDNADAQLNSLDGASSFHEMGMVWSTTNKDGPVCFKSKPVKRQKLKRTTEVTKKNNALIKAYTPQEIPGLSKLILKPINTVLVSSTLPPGININLLWHVSLFFLEKKSRPSWSGYMTDSSHGHYPEKSTVSFLPIIDMDPIDLSCIYSTI